MTKPQNNHKEKYKDYNFTRLKDHKKVKGKIAGVFSRNGINITPTSWVNDRIPELLWVILIRSSFSQIDFIDIFKNLIPYFCKLGIDDITHSSFSQCNEKSASEAIKIICSSEKIRAILRPILLFSDLPVHHIWSKYLDKPTADDLEYLMQSVTLCFFHQSQEATDCRWTRCLICINSGKLNFPEHLKDKMNEIIEYPNIGDMRSVRPSIRSMEMGLDAFSNEEEIDNWANIFRQVCLDNLDCSFINSSGDENEKNESYFDVKVIQESLKKAFFYHIKSGLDHKRDIIFGIGLYALEILQEIYDQNSGRGILSKMGLRTLVELLINLAYLIKMNDENLRMKYKNHGNGELKKMFLKLVESDSLPSFIDIDMLYKLANEDMRQELIDINIGDRAGSNLRTRSEYSDTKDLYDKYYDFTSGYSHGQRSAIKYRVYDDCLNPLHKFHKIPVIHPIVEQSVIYDANLLIEKILLLIQSVYPTFTY